MRWASILPLGLIVLAAAVPSNDLSTDDTTEASVPPSSTPAQQTKAIVVYYNVRAKFSLSCSIGGKISWRKNGKDISHIKNIVLKPLGGIANSILTLSGESTENDHGNYTCSNGVNQLSWVVMGRPRARTKRNVVVTEESEAKITCRVIGRPYPPVMWFFSNSSDKVLKGKEVRDALGDDHVKLFTSKQGIVSGDLVIKKTKKSDRGWYKCVPLADIAANATPSITQLFIKDKYAALWPFIGIIAEVLILVTIIYVYEQRQKKKKSNLPAVGSGDTRDAEGQKRE